LADPWLDRFAATAPRCVLRALVGRGDDRAHALRRELIETGRECLDSAIGLDDPHAWSLREDLAARWPSSVVHSLFGVPDGPRRRATIERCLGAAPDDLHVLRRARELAEQDG
jgi:dTMP kinase